MAQASRCRRQLPPQEVGGAERMTKLLLTVWHTVDDRLGLVKNLKPILNHRVPRESKWAYVFGSATLFAFLLQVVTGVALATVYDPSATGAYKSLEYISRQ